MITKKQVNPGRTAALFFCLGLFLSMTSCSKMIRGYVNKKYPPVSSAAKSMAAVQQSIRQMQNLVQVDMGSKISKSFIDTVFHQYFSQMLAKDSTLGISGLSKIQVVSYPELSLGRQELILNATLNFYLKNDKYVKNIAVAFSGRLAPAIAEDSLILRPSFQRIYIQELKLTKCLFLGSAAKLAVNALCLNFMDNINGQIKNINLKINYPPLPEKPLSTILGNDSNITVKNDYVFKLKRQMINPVLLVEPENILLITQIADNKDSVAIRLNKTAVLAESLSIPQPRYRVDRWGKIVFFQSGPTYSGAPDTAAGTSAVPPSFDELYTSLDTSFRKLWTANLDTINFRDSVSVAVHISYAAMARIVNELFGGVQFSLLYHLDINKQFPEKAITLGEIQKPDCNAIVFDCQLNNCANVLSDCGSCGWLDVLCHIRWTACQGLNGLKWTACQASNGAKLSWCAGELAARKVFCYSEVALIFIYDNLIKPVGTFGGYARAGGTLTGEIDATAPGGINSLGLTGKLQGNIAGAGGINFTPSGLLGLLVCQLPTVANFNVGVGINENNLQLNATMLRKTDVSGPFLNVSMNKLSLPLQLKEPFILEILKQPQLILNCGAGILTGLAVLALKDNATFKQFLEVAFEGRYNLEIQRDFNIYIPNVPIQVQQSQLPLSPSWGAKSLVFNNLK